MNILHYQKLLNILGVQVVSKKYGKSSQIKWSNNLSIILIFVISKFRNTDRSTFRRSIFWPPPKKIVKKRSNKSKKSYARSEKIYSNLFVMHVKFIGQLVSSVRHPTWKI